MQRPAGAKSRALPQFATSLRQAAVFPPRRPLSLAVNCPQPGTMFHHNRERTFYMSTLKTKLRTGCIGSTVLATCMAALPVYAQDGAHPLSDGQSFKTVTV